MKYLASLSNMTLIILLVANCSQWLHSSMTTVANGPANRGPVYTNSACLPAQSDKLSPSLPHQPADSTEDRMMGLLGRKKTLKEFNNTKLVIRRLPQDITMEELLQFLDPIPDHTYLYLAKGDLEFSREESLFARAYINLTRQEDAHSFCKKLDGFPLKSAGRIYRPVFEYAPFHRVPKHTPLKTDSKEGTIESDTDYNAFLKSLQEINVKPPVEERVEQEKSSDNPQTTPLIQHLIQKHKYSNRAPRSAPGNTYVSEPKVIKKRVSGGVKEPEYNTAKEKKTYRGPAQSRSKVICDGNQKPNPKAGSVIIVTDKPTAGKKSAAVVTEDRPPSVHDSYSKHSEYSGKDYKSSSNHNSYYYTSERGGYPSRRGAKKRGRGGKYHSEHSGGYQPDYEDRGRYERKSRYDDWYNSEGDGGEPRGRGRSSGYDSQRYYSSTGGRHC